MIQKQTLSRLKRLVMSTCLLMLMGAWASVDAQAPPSSERQVPLEKKTTSSDTNSDLDGAGDVGPQQNKADHDNVTRLKRIEAIQARLKLIQSLVEDSAEAPTESSPRMQDSPADTPKSPFIQNEAGGMAPAVSPASTTDSPQLPSQYQNASQAKTLRNAAPPTDLRPNGEKELTNSLANGDIQPGEIPLPPRSTEPLSVYELANSLYLSGNWRQALPKYKEYYDNNQPASKEDKWLKMVLASCVRLQGESGVAESIYRELIEVRTPDDDQAEESQTSMHARWFLKQTGDLAKMKQELNELDSELQAIQKAGEDQ